MNIGQPTFLETKLLRLLPDASFKVHDQLWLANRVDKLVLSTARMNRRWNETVLPLALDLDQTLYVEAADWSVRPEPDVDASRCLDNRRFPFDLLRVEEPVIVFWRVKVQDAEIVGD